jgi:hypothetical protein
LISHNPKGKGTVHGSPTQFKLGGRFDLQPSVQADGRTSRALREFFIEFLFGFE